MRTRWVVGLLAVSGLMLCGLAPAFASVFQMSCVLLHSDWEGIPIYCQRYARLIEYGSCGLGLLLCGWAPWLTQRPIPWKRCASLLMAPAGLLCAGAGGALVRCILWHLCQ